jgi:glucosamine-6-phosphate deaminase
MQVIIRDTKEAAIELTAAAIAHQLERKPNSVLGLATGRTMEGLYARLVTLHREEGLDFSLAVTFNLDEYVGLPPTHKNSYSYYMNHHLFEQGKH